MTRASIKHWKNVEAKNAKRDRPAKFLGCTCPNPECRLTWIVCELPQSITSLAALTAKHLQCPNCGIPPVVATPAAVRTLLTSEE